MLRGSEAESQPGPGAFKLSPLQAQELWLWLRSGLADCREARLQPSGCCCVDAGAVLPGPPASGATGARLAREEQSWRRVGLAFEHCFEDPSSYRHNLHFSWWERLCRGLDPAGVALFSRFLEEQVRWWREHEEPSDPGRRARVPIYEATSALFHRLLGAPEATVRRWARRHSFGPAHRHRPFKWGVGERCTLVSISIPGLDPEEHEEAAADVDEHWQDVLGAWLVDVGVPPFATIAQVEEVAGAAGQPPPGWQFGFYASFERETHRREVERLKHGSQRWLDGRGAAGAAEEEIRLRFLALFPGPARSSEPHGVHAQLSRSPPPARLERFAAWLRQGCTDAGRSKQARHVFARGLAELERCPGDPDPARRGTRGTGGSR